MKLLLLEVTDKCYIPIGGSPPLDTTKLMYELMTVSLSLFIFIAVVTSIAILVSILFLWFNISKRNIRYL